MKKINVKYNTILWGIIGFIALACVIFCSVLIARIVNDIDTIKAVDVDSSLINDYQAFKAYGIGVLAFSCIVLIISSCICYLGARSWNYTATL